MAFDIEMVEKGSLEYTRLFNLFLEVLPQEHISSVRRKYHNPGINSIILACLEDENVLGGCIGEPFNENTTYLRYITVSFDRRGEGIGTKLLQFFEDYAQKKNGCKKITLDIKDPEHVPWFEKKGYEQVWRDPKKICMTKFVR